MHSKKLLFLFLTQSQSSRHAFEWLNRMNSFLTDAGNHILETKRFSKAGIVDYVSKIKDAGNIYREEFDLCDTNSDSTVTHIELVNCYRLHAYDRIKKRVDEDELFSISCQKVISN